MTKHNKVKKFVLFVTVGAILLTIPPIAQKYIIVNTTPSLPGRVYLINHDRNLVRNATVMFCHTEKVNALIQMIRKQTGACPLTGATPNLKIIAGVPGDLVIADGKGEITINGNIFTGTSTKPQLPSWRFEGVIPPHRYLLLTHHRDGLDSRYFGFIAEEQIISTIKELF